MINNKWSVNKRLLLLHYLQLSEKCYPENFASSALLSDFQWKDSYLELACVTSFAAVITKDSQDCPIREFDFWKQDGSIPILKFVQIMF